MKINERALNAIKKGGFSGESLSSVFENMAVCMAEQCAEEMEFTLTFDKDDSASIGELLPEITLRLKEKTEEENE